MPICKYCLIRSASVAYNETADIVTYTFPDVTTINNKDTLSLKLVQAVPADATVSSKVNFVINNKTFPALMQNGNYVRATQLKQCRTYVVYIGTDTGTAIVRSYLPSTGLVYPSYSPTATNS